MPVSISEQRLNEKRNTRSWILSAPVILWLVVFFLVPYLIIFLYSFLTTTIYDVQFRFSLEAFRQIFRPIYLKPFLLAFRLATITTLLCMVFGYPVAYYIARSTPRLKNILLLLIIIPFWTNFVIRIFSWRVFLSANGVMNEALLFFNLIDEPLRLLRTDLAVIMVTVYVYLPYMIFPLYSAIEKMDFTLLDAARDLGANEVTSFFKITLPLSREGIIAGIILVFIPALGTYVIPQLVGHQNALYIGQIITYKIKNIPRNWPVASALSLALLIVVSLILFFLTRRYSRERKTS